MGSLRYVPYHLARSKIKSGDTLLFAPRLRWWWPPGWWTLLICWAGREGGRWYLPWTWFRLARHCHAAKAVYWHDELMVVQETTAEGHFLSLSNLVATWPGKIDVYRPAFRSIYAALKSARASVHVAKRPYGWRNLLRATLHRWPLIWRLLPRDTDSLEGSKLPPFCSMMVSYCDRVGGVDPSEKPDRLTEPHDLARSSRYEYLFTLGTPTGCGRVLVASLEVAAIWLLAVVAMVAAFMCAWGSVRLMYQLGAL